MTRFPRRLARLTAGAAAIALAVPTTAVSQETTPPAVEAAAVWLVDQLVDGNRLEGDFGTEYGPTADVALGLLASDQQTDTLTDVLAFLTTPEAVDAYVHGGGFDGSEVDDPTYVGANAKLGFLTTTAGLDPRTVGGDDLVEGIQSLENDETGAFEDRSDYGNFANVFGQSFAVLFLHVAPGVDPSAASIAYLREAQCDDGGFPESFGGDTCTSNPDATGLALQALAASAGIDAGARAAVDAAAAWLISSQDADGAWGEPQNVNSTGYAGMGMLGDGRDVIAARAFLATAQNDDGGLPVTPGEASNAFATAQALPLLGGTAFVDLVPDVPTAVGRVAGDTRVLTAVALSQATFGALAADTVVLARSDLFADALAGTPLAVTANGPLLTTDPSTLDADVLAEIQRVLPAGGRVHVLGGPDAIAEGVDAALVDAGFEVERVFGADRYATSVAIATELGDPDLQLLTTGLDFPDALAAGTAAAAHRGAVLLTNGASPSDPVTAYLTGRPGRQVAVGGPAATAHPDATRLVGDTRNETAALVADEFFPDAAVIGLARNDLFVDALVGGVLLARTGGPLALTQTNALPDATADLLCRAGDGLRRVSVLGGPSAVSDDVVATVTAIADGAAGTDC